MCQQTQQATLFRRKQRWLIVGLPRYCGLCLQLVCVPVNRPIFHQKSPIFHRKNPTCNTLWNLHLICTTLLRFQLVRIPIKRDEYFIKRVLYSVKRTLYSIFNIQYTMIHFFSQYAYQSKETHISSKEPLNPPKEPYIPQLDISATFCLPSTLSLPAKRSRCPTLYIYKICQKTSILHIWIYHQTFRRLNIQNLPEELNSQQLDITATF